MTPSSSPNNNKKQLRRDIDSRSCLAFHVSSLSKEIEETDRLIHVLIHSISEGRFDDDDDDNDVEETYSKIRRLKLVREIMRDQQRELEQLLRRLQQQQ
jgi:hypothetical protein